MQVYCLIPFYSPIAVVAMQYKLLSSHGVKFSTRLLSRVLDLCGNQPPSFSLPLGTSIPALAQQLFSEIRAQQGHSTLENYLALMRILAKFKEYSE